MALLRVFCLEVSCCGCNLTIALHHLRENQFIICLMIVTESISQESFIAYRIKLWNTKNISNRFFKRKKFNYFQEFAIYPFCDQSGGKKIGWNFHLISIGLNFYGGFRANCMILWPSAKIGNCIFRKNENHLWT